MDTLVSVIIPTYKRPESLRRAVESVLYQKYSFLEILIVNDDDDDDDKTILKIIKNFNDKRVIYFKNCRTKGANGARNTGILNAKGNFIAFLDDDDEWYKSKLETQLKCLRSKNDTFGGVYSGYKIEYKNHWNDYYGYRKGRMLNDILLNNIKVCAGSNLLIKSSVIGKIGLWDEEMKRQQDLEFLIRLLDKYDLAFDNNIAVRIYGHNTPNPKKAFNAREIYLKKISKYLDELSGREKNEFYSDHCRRQAYYLIKQKKYIDAIVYWKKAINYKKVSLRKDAKLLYHLIK